MPQVQQDFVPQAEEDVRFVRLPRRQDERLRVVREGQEAKNHRHWPHEVPQGCPAEVQERLQGGHPGQGRGQEDLSRLQIRLTILIKFRSIYFLPERIPLHVLESVLAEFDFHRQFRMVNYLKPRRPY